MVVNSGAAYSIREYENTYGQVTILNVTHLVDNSFVF